MNKKDILWHKLRIDYSKYYIKNLRIDTQSGSILNKGQNLT